MAVRIDRRQLAIDLRTAEPTLRKEVDRIVREELFEPAVEAMKAEFRDDNVTREIQGGVGADNITNTLVGSFREDDGDSKPNLFNFIGFEAGSTPTAEIEKRLDPRHPDGPQMIYKGMDRGGRMEFQYEIRGPNEKAIWNATPLPWMDEGGPSWARRIEQGIAGVGHFLNKIMPAKGRGLGSASGGGIQVDGTLRSGHFRPTSYLSKIFNDFLRRAGERKATGRPVRSAVVRR